MILYDFDIFGLLCAGFLRVSASQSPKARSHFDHRPRCYTFPKTRRMVADTFAGHGLKEHLMVVRIWWLYVVVGFELNGVSMCFSYFPLIT